MKSGCWQKILLIVILDIVGIVAILSTTTRAEEQFLAAAPSPTPRKTLTPRPSPTAKSANRVVQGPRNSLSISLNSYPLLSPCVLPDTSVVFTWTLAYSPPAPILGAFSVIGPDGPHPLASYSGFESVYPSTTVSNTVSYTVPMLLGTYYAQIEFYYAGNPTPDIARIHFTNQCGNLHVVKFEDKDGRNGQGPGEPSIAGWGMTVTPPSDSFPPPGDGYWREATGADGSIKWDIIPTGTYTVTETDGTAAGWILTTPPNPKIVDIHAGETVTVTFGNQAQYWITGTKTNEQGTGLSGWTIHAQGQNPSTPVLTTMTDAQGRYRFDTITSPVLTVPPSDWTVWEDLQSGWTPISPTSQNVSCTRRQPPPFIPSPSVIQGSGFNLFLPLIIRSTGSAPAATGCGSADFQNRQIIPTGSFNPKGIAVDLITHNVYLGVKRENKVYVLDPSLQQIAGPIQVGNEPFGIAVNESKHEVYVANYGDNSISVISTDTKTPTAPISLAPYGEPTYVGVYMNKIYVPLHASGKLAIVNADTKFMTKTLDVGSGAFGLAMDPSHCAAYVSSRDAQWVTTVNICTDQISSTQRINLGPPGQTPHYEPYALGVDSALAQLYTIIHPYPDPNKGVNPEEVWTYRLPPPPPVPGTVTSPISKTIVGRGGDELGAGVGIVVNPTTHNVFVTNYADDSVSYFDGRQGPQNAAFTLQSCGNRPFNDPIMLAVDPILNRVYVTNHSSPPSAGMQGAVGIIADTGGQCP
ncbi:MAG: hypothetical protein HY782_00735 [Chloroflexi bacterium]|nr:hypothetical protein [Chloroflexota bacterium]